MTRTETTTVFCLLFATTSAFGQSVAIENKLTLTITNVERVTERELHTPYAQVETPGKGREFAKLTFTPRWLAGQTGDPCGFKSAPRLVLAGDYELINAAGRKVLGMDVIVTGGGACKSFEVLFQPSPVGVSFTKLRFKGGEADISKVPGATGSASGKQ